GTRESRKKLAGPSVKVLPSAVTISRAMRSTDLPSRRLARTQLWKLHIPFSCSRSRLMRRRSPHFRAQKSTHSGRSRTRSVALRPPVGPRVRQERARLRRRRQRADGVEVEPAEERLVADRPRRRQPQVAPLAGELLVDEVVRRPLLPLRGPVGEGNLHHP